MASSHSVQASCCCRITWETHLFCQCRGLHLNEWPRNIITQNKEVVGYCQGKHIPKTLQLNKSLFFSPIFDCPTTETFTSITLFTTFMRRLFPLQCFATSSAPWTPLVSLLHGDKIRTPQSAGSTSGQEQPSKPIVTSDSQYPARKEAAGTEGGGVAA